jgi:hypothetical protein
VRFSDRPAASSNSLKSRAARFSKKPYLDFSFRKGRKPNFKRKLNPALIRKTHAPRSPQLVFNKSLSRPSTAPLWIPVEIVNMVLTFWNACRILLWLWMCLSARQGGQAL